MNLDAAFLERLLASTRASIIATDERGRVLYWNQQSEAFYGYSAEEAIGQFILDVIGAPELQPEVPAIIAQLAGGVPWTRQFQARRRDGTTFTVEVNNAPIFNEKGRFIGVVGVSLDVTERVRAVEALRRETELVRSVIDNAPVILFAVNRDGIFTSSRGRSLASIGLREDEVVGQSAIDMYVALTVDTAAGPLSFQEVFHRVLAGESIHGHTVAAGTHFDAWYAPSRNRAGDIVGMVGAALDVTDRVDLERRLREIEKLEALGLLAGGVAHDFNNMLTAILGHAEILLTDLHDARREDAEAIRHAAESAAGVTRQLLAFTRRQHQELRQIDVNSALRSFEPLLRTTVGERIRLELDLAPVPAMVLADSSQMEQVILNLVLNARDAMPDGGTLRIATTIVEPSETSSEARGSTGRVSHAGGGELPCECRAMGAARCVQITVADTGIGMSAATRERIFEPFFTTKERGRGTGLGLASVHGIVSQSGGRIFVDSEVGAGTVFRVLLPAVADGSPSSSHASHDTRPAAGSARTILLVEDEESVRQVATTMLERAGYRVVTCASGEEALAVVGGDESIDLVLTDMVMPGMGGPELARAIHQIRPGLAILFMSGYAEGDAPGVQADVQKPFTRAQLVAAVERRLEQA